MMMVMMTMMVMMVMMMTKAAPPDRHHGFLRQQYKTHSRSALCTMTGSKNGLIDKYKDVHVYNTKAKDKILLIDVQGWCRTRQEAIEASGAKENGEVATEDALRLKPALLPLRTHTHAHLFA